MKHFPRLIVLAAACLAAAAPASAEPGQEIEPSDALSLLLPPEKGKALCYVGTGDPVTFPLEDIPRRDKPRAITIKRFLFELTSEQHYDDDTVTPPTPGAFYHRYRIVAEVEGTKVPLISAGECGSASPNVFGCGSDCDGGTMAFHADPRQHGARHGGLQDGPPLPHELGMRRWGRRRRQGRGPAVRPGRPEDPHGAGRRKAVQADCHGLQEAKGLGELGSVTGVVRERRRCFMLGRRFFAVAAVGCVVAPVLAQDAPIRPRATFRRPPSTRWWRTPSFRSARG